MSPSPHRRPRIALYGHDTQGLGHLRRNLVLASAFASDHPAGLGAEVLLLTGASEVGMFPRPRGVDALVLPGVRKDEQGAYAPRQMRGGLADVVRFRKTMIEAALTQFPPDLLVVDKTPYGFQGELRTTLRTLRAAGTRLVLGLRDVLDDLPTTRAQWRKDLADEAVRAFYDEVWVYGDPSIHDLTVATGMAPDVAACTHHLGYLSADRIDSAERQHRPDTGGRDYVLVMVGGGQDGAELSRLAAAMTPPPGLELIVLTGPQLDEEEVREVRRVAEHSPHVQVMRFSRHGAAWLTGAAAVITMGGANTVAEILDTDVPALIVPRVSPRAEQLVRAEALAAHGYLSVLRPDELTTARLQDWTLAAVGTRTERGGMNRGGVAATTARARELIRPPSGHRPDVAPTATVLPLRSPHVA
ncbi:glycosyltransferase family protein [Granulicoccus sp. GXG6511]|uniref:glycosyltransferase family protein n=1 Tax=Granulicoccus sp. GXG6511 TaxID=3381351 RepID=UPI003D7E07FC